MKNNKLYSVLLSFIIAFGLWLYVVNNVSVEAEETIYNIPVALEGEALLNERNLLITGQSSQTVNLTLSGSRSDLNKVNASNITIKANLSTIDAPGDRIQLGYTISYPGEVPSNAFVEQNRNPSYIYVDVDSRRNKDVPVVIQWTGTRSDDYIYDTENAVLDYSVINVKGPAEVVDQIDHALVQIDLTDRAVSMSESYRYTLCDISGDPVDASTITTNVDEARVDLKIHRIKEVKLVANVIYGGGASEMNTVVTVEPSVIRLSGSDAILEEIGDTYTVGPINLAEIEKSQELKYAITIPEEVNNLTGVTEAVVGIRFTGLTTREFYVTNMQAVNIPEGLEAEIMNTSVRVKVRGPMTEMNKLTESNISIVVDFSAAEIGNSTYKAKLLFDAGFPNVGAMNAYSVSAMVRAAEPEE